MGLVRGWEVGSGVPTVSWDKRRRDQWHRILEKQRLRGADDLCMDVPWFLTMTFGLSGERGRIQTVGSMVHPEKHLGSYSGMTFESREVTWRPNANCK